MCFIEDVYDVCEVWKTPVGGRLDMPNRKKCQSILTLRGAQRLQSESEFDDLIAIWQRGPELEIA